MPIPKQMLKDFEFLQKQFTPEVQADVERKILSLSMTKLKVPKGARLIRTKQRQGDCYHLAGSFVMVNSGWMLCHGLLDLPTGPLAGPGYEHAWAEKGKMLYEPVFNYFYKKSDYYKVYLPNVSKRYTRTQVRNITFEKENWGPW
jgi:hypothetical protein